MDRYWDNAKSKWDERARRDVVGYTSSAETRDDHEAQGRRHAAEIAELLDAAGARWGAGLEIGCGDGRVLKHFMARFKTLHGCDISPEMVELARREVPGPSYHVLGNEELPAKDLDVVYSYGVFQHVPRPVFGRYVTAAHRALAPGGIFLFHLKRPYTLRRRLKALLRADRMSDETWNIRYYTWRDLRKCAAAEGFQVVQERTEELDLYAVWRK